MRPVPPRAECDELAGLVTAEALQHSMLAISIGQELHFFIGSIVNSRTRVGVGVTGIIDDDGEAVRGKAFGHPALAARPRVY